VAWIGGVALAAGTTIPPLWLWVSGLLLLAAAGLAARRARRAGAVLFCAAALALGAWSECSDLALSARRAAWLPADGSPLELQLRGRLLAPPEIDAHGQRRLLVLAAPEEGGGDAPASRIALSVAPSGAEATAGLDALRGGDTVRAWCRVRRPLPFGNPGVPDPREALRARGLAATGRVKNAWLVEGLGPGPPGPRRWADGVKRRARQRLDALFDDPLRRHLLGAMLLGDRLALDEPLQRRWRGAGLAHLVAISGLHVGLLVLVGVLLLRRVRVGWRVMLLPAAALLCGFALLVGPRPSVLRAVLAAGLILLGRALGRDGDALNGLALLALLLLAVAPGRLHDPAFRLSFLACAGILLLAGPLSRAIPLPRQPARGIALSAAAYAATAPVLAWHFGLLAPVGLLTNLVAVPLCALALVSGYACLLFSCLPWIAAVCGAVAGQSVDALDLLARVAAAVDSGAAVVPRPAPSGIAIYYLALGAVAGVVRAPRRAGGRRALLLLPFGLAVLWLHLGPPSSAGDGALEIDLIDVGQGQAVALHGARGGVLLVDAGGSAAPGFDPGRRLVLPYLLSRGHRRVEALILSHEDVDHAGGAASLLRELEVGELWIGPGSHRSQLMRELLALAREQGSAVVLAERGYRAERAGIPLWVLAPGRGEAHLDSNDRSIVLLAGTPPHRLLVPGDLSTRAEAPLLACGLPLRAEALVLAHHGSRDGSSEELLRRVHPDWALVSAGRGNRFNHPHAETLQRVERSGATLLGTHRQGLVTLRATAEGWRTIERR